MNGRGNEGRLRIVYSKYWGTKAKEMAELMRSVA